MAVITTILSPDQVALARYRHCIDALADRVLPGGVVKHQKTRVAKKKGYLLSILGRRDLVTERGLSAVAGLTADRGDNDRWWHVGGAVPDGSFALFRSDDSGMECVTDFTSSKSIWYARLPCGGLVTSTCFEVVVGILGDFQVDDRALGWFLSSGTCGPKRSWDKRVKPIAPNTRLHATLCGNVVSYREYLLDREDDYFGDIDEAKLASELGRTMSTFAFGDRPWMLALSGGYDSRAILHGTRHVKDLTCITWADADDTEETNSDLAIARALADRAGRHHLVKRIERPTIGADLELAIQRFVRYSDGRVDNVFAYVDGMKIWDELCTEPAAGLLRGDELFGSSIAMKSGHILRSMRLLSFADYAPSDDQRQMLAQHNHELPNGLQKRTGEDTSQWRMRLRADFEIPTVYAALNGIRSRFIECSCPLLSRHLVNLAKSLTNRQLADRLLYKRAVARMYPDVPIAAQRSVVSRPGFLSTPIVIEILGDHLNSTYARNVLGARCARRASDRLARVVAADSDAIDRSGRMDSGARGIPTWVKQVKQHLKRAPRLNLQTLAMRSYLASVVESEMSEAAALAADAWRHVRSVSA